MPRNQELERVVEHIHHLPDALLNLTVVERS
jgi:hypothetical protein